MSNNFLHYKQRAFYIEMRPYVLGEETSLFIPPDHIPEEGDMVMREISCFGVMLVLISKADFERLYHDTGYVECEGGMCAMIDPQKCAK